jgi:SAM-dependent methyltransferase
VALSTGQWSSDPNARESRGTIVGTVSGVMASSHSTAYACRMTRETHWNQVYDTKPTDGVSWYQPTPERSLEYIRRYAARQQRVLDAGGGASLLVDSLLDHSYLRPIVLDVSSSALGRAQARLLERAALVDWVVADLTQSPALPAVDLWHDRAVLHFLTDPADQLAYAQLVTRTLRPNGHVVLATFALDGPERCSGLPVQRHDAQSLSRLLGSPFELREESRELHRTPSGGEQKFIWAVFSRT